jgi:hypothetical protein
MIEVRTFEQKHIEQLKPRQVFEGELSVLGPPPFLAHTFLVDEKPIAVFGGIYFGPQQMRVWAVFSDEITKVPVEFFRKTRRLILAYFKQYNLLRMEFTVKADFVVGKRFAEQLGFVREAVMRKWGHDGSDYILYARVI